MQIIILRPAIILSIALLVTSQVPRDKLANLGIIIKDSKALKIAGSYENRYIVLNLVPTIENVSGCGSIQIAKYKEMLERLLIPIKDALDLQESLIVIDNETVNNNYRPQYRFVGAVIGTIALGVATAAQVTAGVALMEAREAKRDISVLKEAIGKTQNSIEKLQNSAGEQILALKMLQDYVNGEIKPAIEELGCETAALKLGIALTQHYTELTNAFGSNLGSIGEKSLTLQALSSLYKTNITDILTTTNLGKTDIYDIIYTEQVKGRVIDVDLRRYMVTISVKIPILSEIPGVLIYEVSSISYNIDGTEWYAAVPDHILSKSAYIGGADISDCIESGLTYICPRDPAQIIADNQQQCFLGHLDKCPITKVVDNLVPKFAFINGGVVANCIASTCTCGEERVQVSQDRNKGVTFLTHDNCGLIGINGMEFHANKKGSDATWNVSPIGVGPAVSLRPVVSATNFLNSSRKDLMKAKEILNQVGNLRDLTVITIINIVIIAVLLIYVTGLGILYYQLKSALVMRDKMSVLNNSSYSLEPRTAQVQVTKPTSFMG
uniref:Fusion glycoprotein F0 n=1 Tax=Respirovirus suis TaxID=3052733 RepID=A0A2S1TJ84_9MONO|nr:fusion protein [Respirovirus suis]